MTEHRHTHIAGHHSPCYSLLYHTQPMLYHTQPMLYHTQPMLYHIQPTLLIGITCLEPIGVFPWVLKYMWRCASQMALQRWVCIPTAESMAHRWPHPVTPSGSTAAAGSCLILGHTVLRAASVTSNGWRRWEHTDSAKQVSQAACASWVGLVSAQSGLQCSFPSSSAPAFSPLISQKLGPNKYFVPQTQILESLSCNTELNEAQTGEDFSKVS